MTTKEVAIVAGPSKYDLIILGLAEAQEVEFTFDEWGKRKVIVTAVTRDRSNKWLISGVVLDEQEGYPLMKFQGCYDLTARTGYVHSDRKCLRCREDQVGLNGTRCFTCSPARYPELKCGPD